MILQLARSFESDLFLGDGCQNVATSGVRLDLSGPVWDSSDLPGAKQVQVERNDFGERSKSNSCLISWVQLAVKRPIYLAVCVE